MTPLSSNRSPAAANTADGGLVNSSSVEWWAATSQSSMARITNASCDTTWRARNRRIEAAVAFIRSGAPASQLQRGDDGVEQRRQQHDDHDIREHLRRLERLGIPDDA